jgi:hypothetical protein
MNVWSYLRGYKVIKIRDLKGLWRTFLVPSSWFFVFAGTRDRWDARDSPRDESLVFYCSGLARGAPGGIRSFGLQPDFRGIGGAVAAEATQTS